MSAFSDFAELKKKPGRRPHCRSLAYLLTAVLMGCGGGSGSMAPPLVKSQTVTTGIAQPVQIDVLTGAQNPGGLPLTVEILPGTVGGTATVGAAGVVTFTPASGFAGRASFNFEAVDSGGHASQPATVTIDVEPSATVLIQSGAALKLVGAQSRSIYAPPQDGATHTTQVGLTSKGIVPGWMVYLTCAKSGSTQTYQLLAINLADAAATPQTIESGITPPPLLCQFSSAPSVDGMTVWYGSPGSSDLRRVVLSAQGAPVVSTIAPGPVSALVLVDGGNTVIYNGGTPSGTYSVPADGSAAPTLLSTYLLALNPVGNGSGLVSIVPDPTGAPDGITCWQTVLFDVATQAQTVLQGYPCDSNGGPAVQVAPDGTEVALEYIHGDPIVTSSATITTIPAQWANAPAAGPTQVALQPDLVYGFSPDSAWFLIAVRTQPWLDMYGSQGPQLITAQGVASVPSPSLASFREPPAAFTPDSRTVLALITPPVLPPPSTNQLWAFPVEAKPVATQVSSDVSTDIVDVFVAADSHEVAYDATDGSLYLFDLRAPTRTVQLSGPGVPTQIVGIWPTG